VSLAVVWRVPVSSGSPTRIFTLRPIASKGNAKYRKNSPLPASGRFPKSRAPGSRSARHPNHHPTPLPPGSEPRTGSDRCANPWKPARNDESFHARSRAR